MSLNMNKITDYEKFFNNFFKPKKPKKPKPQKPKPILTKKEKKRIKKRKKYATDPNLEHKIKARVRQLYGFAIQLLKNGRPRKAYTYYRALSKIISTEPTVWLRMAECIVADLQAPVMVTKVGKNTKEEKINKLADTIFVGAFQSQKAEEPDAEKLGSQISPEEFTYCYADMCMMTCRTLLRDTDNEKLKSWASGVHGYIILKRGDFERAATLFSGIMREASDPDKLPKYLRHYALIMMIQNSFIQGKLNRGLNLGAKLKEVRFGENRSAASHSVLYNEALGWILKEHPEHAATNLDVLLEEDYFTETLALAARVYEEAGKTTEYEEVFDQLVKRAQPGHMNTEELEEEFINLALAEKFQGFKSVADFDFKNVSKNPKTYKPDPNAVKSFFKAEEESYKELGEIIEEAIKTYQKTMGIPDSDAEERPDSDSSGNLLSDEEEEEDEEYDEEEEEGFEMNKPSTSKG